MTDRELLELAAKAAGLGVTVPVFGVPPFMGLRLIGEALWNPLTDDGDALRLAVKLKIIVSYADAGGGPYVMAGQRLGPFSHEPLPVKVLALDEELEATRRAIVRAAAEIGKEME
jgi:hypothetical protein